MNVHLTREELNREWARTEALIRAYLYLRRPDNGFGSLCLWEAEIQACEQVLAQLDLMLLCLKPEAGHGLPEEPDNASDVGTWDTPDTQLGMFGSNKPLRKRKPAPQQLEMFSAREVVQYTHNHPVLPDKVAMILVSEEPRTPQQIEADKIRQANDQTKPLL